jgi:dolichol-phosphate mannosyltransferase
MKDKSESLLIIIPTYNEAHNIKKLINEIRKYMAPCGLLIVDDNSPDGTADIVKKMQKYDKNIYLIQRKGKSGLASAMITGFKWGLNAGYEYLCEMDGDLSHNPKYLTELVEKINEYDFVVGSRNIQSGGILNWPLRRRILSKLGSFYARTILSAPIYDFTSGFILLRKQVLESINLNSIKAEGYGFLIELKYKAYKKGFTFTEVSIIFEDRVGGVSKISKKIIFEAFWKVPFFRFKL